MFAALPQRHPGTDRIVGGEDAKPKEIPYQIRLIEFKEDPRGSADGYSDEIEFPLPPFQHHCGGSLIVVNNTQFVLTASHCVYASSADYMYTVGGMLTVLETTGFEQIRKISKLAKHEEYNLGKGTGDIALLAIDKPFEITEHVATISLPTRFQNTTGIGVASGWGYDASGTPPDHLQKVEVPIVSDEICQEAYKDFALHPVPSNICAGYMGEGGKDACRGDSGGPLRSVSGGYVAGIVSYGKVSLISVTFCSNRTYFNLDLFSPPMIIIGLGMCASHTSRRLHRSVSFH